MIWRPGEFQDPAGEYPREIIIRAVRDAGVSSDGPFATQRELGRLSGELGCSLVLLALVIGGLAVWTELRVERLESVACASSPRPAIVDSLVCLRK